MVIIYSSRDKSFRKRSLSQSVINNLELGDSLFDQLKLLPKI